MITAGSPPSTTTWSNLTLVFPNGSSDTLSPLLTNGQPTGVFTLSSQPNCSYCASGTASSNTNKWQSITVTFADQTSWTFTPVGDGYTYMPSMIFNRMGRYISILRDSCNGNRVSTVTDDSASPNTLLTFNYSGGYLSSITDAYGRCVSYAFGSAAGTTCLTTVSQISPSGSGAQPALETYGYTSINGQPHITSITTPSPTGSGTSLRQVFYDTSIPAKVTSVVDANGNTTSYNYCYNNGTIVQVANAQGTVQAEWTENFDPANNNLSTGVTDASGFTTVIEYGDPTNPFKPTRVTDKAGYVSNTTYDSHGNVLTATDPRGTVTTNTISYATFPLGRLTSVQQGTKTPTGFTYYEPSGLVQTVITPQPGTTGGPTVVTSFTYDSLGNVLTKTTPGNNAVSTITTTCNYTTDGTYTQPAMLGQPLTVTDNLGHITHLRYDARGNVTETTDALGHTSDFYYNIADQLITSVRPSN